MFYKNKHLFKAVTIGLFLLSITGSVYGQNSINKDTIYDELDDYENTPYILWIKDIPVDKGEKKQKNLFKNVGKIFFGKPTVFLKKPVSLIASHEDSLWILDQGDNKIVQSNKGISKVPSFITKSKFKFYSLLDITYMSDKEFLFTDSKLNQIFQINIKEKKIRILNDSLKLKQPTGIAYSSTTNEIWVVETAAHQISILNKDGKLVKRIGSRGGGEGEFNYPTFIWIDKFESVYVVDAMNFRIQIFDLEGKFKTSFGRAGDGSGSFASPKGIATDTFGNIYIVDALFHVVQVFDKSGALLETFGSQGHGNGQFWMPTGVYIDDNNYIYIADSYNSRVQVFQLMNGR